MGVGMGDKTQISTAVRIAPQDRVGQMNPPDILEIPVGLVENQGI